MHPRRNHVKRAAAVPIVLVVALTAWACRSSAPAQPGSTAESAGPTGAPRLWFADLGQPLSLQVSEATELIDWVKRRLNTSSNGPVTPLSPRLESDGAARIVFLSASDGRAPARVGLGAGRGVMAALERALADVRAQLPARHPITWLALDVVATVGPEQRVAGDGALDMTRGIHGLALPAATGLAFLPAEILGRRLVSRARRLYRERMRARSRTRGARVDSSLFSSLLADDRALSVRAFTTESFFSDLRTDTVQAAVRAHPAERRVDDQRLRAAIVAGADYLARATDGDGRYRYAYLAKQDGDKDKYNMVRHAGTAFSVIQAYELLGRPELLAAGERAIDYMKRHMVAHGPAEADMQALAFAGKIKLGGVALAALALATHARVTGRDTHLALAQRLCRYMVGNQHKDGSFVHQRKHPGGDELPFVSMYYPGEALLGLLSVYRLDRNPAWLDAAEKGARYLIEIRDADVATRELKHDHWLLYALELLHAERPKPMYLRHAMRIAEAIIGAQKKAGLPADQIGAYALVEPRATPIATRNEGLMAAYRTARKNGENAMAERILTAVELGNEVLISMRIAPVRAMYLQRPQRALGGVTRSHQNYEVRIDYVQHSLSAWLALLAARTPTQ